MESIPVSNTGKLLDMSAQSHSIVIGICHKSCGTNGCWKDDIGVFPAVKGCWSGKPPTPPKLFWFRISWKSCPNPGMPLILLGRSPGKLVLGGIWLGAKGLCSLGAVSPTSLGNNGEDSGAVVRAPPGRREDGERVDFPCSGGFPCVCVASSGAVLRFFLD